MNLESTCANGYFPAPPLSILNKELVAGLESWKKIYICPACAAQSLARFRTIKSIPYSRCRTCGFRFANPIPPNEVITTFYNSSFYANYRKFEENHIKQHRYFSISINVDTMYHLGAWLGDDKSAEILDYGCGPGTFLAILRDKFGFLNAERIELNKDSLRVAKNSYGLNINYSKETLFYQLYDYIVLLEVIEHIPEPDQFLENIISLLKPGGRILISTPAVDNPIGLFLPSHAEAPYSAPCHVSLFTKKALECLLYRFNFDIERMEMSESWRVMEKIIAKLFYNLDFLSPRHDDDFSDILYTPNTLGNLLGFESQRELSSFFWRGLRRVDNLLARILRRYSSMVPMNGHMNVLACRRV